MRRTVIEGVPSEGETKLHRISRTLAGGVHKSLYGSVRKKEKLNDEKLVSKGIRYTLNTNRKGHCNLQKVVPKVECGD